MRVQATAIIILLSSQLLSQKLDIEGDFNLNNHKIKNLADPADPQDAVTKAYIDQMSEILLNAGINGVIEDIDGNVYKTVKIGSQVWMAENLKTSHYNDGTVLPKVSNDTLWSHLAKPGYCWYSNDSSLNAERLGALYNYYTVADTNTLNVCPSGWHVPSYSEWINLIHYLELHGYGFGGSGGDVGKSLAASFRWSDNALIGTVGNDLGSNNSSGFSGLPSGNRYIDGTFYNVGLFGYWWSITEDNSVMAKYIDLNYNSSSVFGLSTYKGVGFSVRCVRD